MVAAVPVGLGDVCGWLSSRQAADPLLSSPVSPRASEGAAAGSSGASFGRSIAVAALAVLAAVAILLVLRISIPVASE